MISPSSSPSMQLLPDCDRSCASSMLDPNAPEAFDMDNPNVKEEYLHPCCQKEIKNQKIKNQVMTKLRAADITRQALERRRDVFGVDKADGVKQHRHEHGSGCCFMTQDYTSLARLRAARGRVREPDHITEGRPTVEGGRGDREADSDVDSDDELLQELEDETREFMELRAAEMLRRAEEAEELRRLGVGVHTALHAEDVLRLVRVRVAGLVCHLYDPQSDLSAALDLYLEELASRFPGTRFVRCEARQARMILERLHLQEAAKGSVLTFKDGCIADHCRDLKRFGSERDAQVHGDVVEQWLRHCHVLSSDRPRLDVARATADEGFAPGRDGALERARRVGDEGQYYECGLEGCQRTFVHRHWGVGEVPQELNAGMTDL